MGEIFKEFSKQYGPHAFGLLSVLIIWVAIVNPIIEKNTLDFAAQQKVLEALNNTLNIQQSIIRDQERLSAEMTGTAAALKDAAKIVVEGHKNAVE